MENCHRVITCASYGGTGSSAITDLLKEVKNVNCLGEFEFAITHEVDGISDLQHYLVDDYHRLKTDEAIYRFKKLKDELSGGYNKFFNNKFDCITDAYIEKLVDIKWTGYWHQHIRRGDKYSRFIKYGLERRIKTKIKDIKRTISRERSQYEAVPYAFNEECYVALPGDNFFNITREYMDELFQEIDPNYKYDYLALDQLVPPVNLARYTNYFNNIKVIVVDRDPRDLYLLNKMFWKEGWILSDDVKQFVNWFKIIRNDINRNCEDNKKVIRIRFEDLIFNYEITVQRIFSFLEIKSKYHINKFKYFNPKVSIKNCKLYEKFDLYEDDIKYIEKNLSEFCYKK